MVISYLMSQFSDFVLCVDYMQLEILSLITTLKSRNQRKFKKKLASLFRTSAEFGVHNLYHRKI